MKPAMKKELINLMKEAIRMEDDDRDGWVYENLAKDMAAAAGAVYDACLASSRFMDSEYVRS